MSNNNNKFEGDLEKFIRNLFGEKAKKTKNDNIVDMDHVKKKKEKQPIDMRKWTKSIIALTVIFAIIIIALANVYIVKEDEYRVV